MKSQQLVACRWIQTIDVSIIGDSFAPSLPSPVGRGDRTFSQRGRARKGAWGNSAMCFGKLNNW